MTSESKVGDIVVIKELSRPEGHLITHRVVEVLYPNGLTTDPFTGKAVHSIYYSDQVANPSLERFKDNKNSENTETSV